MRQPPRNLLALFLSLFFALILPTHNHAEYQVCDADGESITSCDADQAGRSIAHNHDQNSPDKHHHHSHHCSICSSFTSYAYLTAAPLPLTSLDLLTLATLPRPPTLSLESPAHSHPGRDPPSFI